MPVYMIQAGKDGPVKIGWSANVLKRHLAIQPTLPVETIVIRLIDSDRWVEHWLHQKFTHVRLLGEWFNFLPEMLTVDPPAKKPTSLPRKAAFPERIQAKVPAGTIDALKAAAADNEDFTDILRRVIDEWFRAQSFTKPKKRASVPP